MDFIYPFTQRILSACQSYFGYKKPYNRWAMFGITLIVMFQPLCNFVNHWIWIVYISIHVLISFMKMISFDKRILVSLKKYKDIHFWEDLLTGGYFIYMILIGNNIILTCCAVYPALIIHKGVINVSNNLSFFAEATDDPTGKTYGIPLLGIKIRRSSTKIRLILAGISLIAVGIVMYYSIKLSLHII